MFLFEMFIGKYLILRDGYGKGLLLQYFHLQMINVIVQHLFEVESFHVYTFDTICNVVQFKQLCSCHAILTDIFYWCLFSVCLSLLKMF